jgi:Na+/H+-dicarboxylate symporter
LKREEHRVAKKLTLYIMIGLILGLIVGAVMHGSMTPEAIADANKFFKMITDIFLRLIKMIVAPLVFATLVAGIVHMGDTASLSRVGAKTIVWFLGATVVSLLLGMVLVNLLQPGIGSGLDIASATGPSGVEEHLGNDHRNGPALDLRGDGEYDDASDCHIFGLFRGRDDGRG